MIRLVISILKKHLDLSREARNQMDAMLTDIPNYDILAEYPDYETLRKLTHDLVDAIRGQDMADLVDLPPIDKLAMFLKRYFPHDFRDDDYFDRMAAELIKWLRHGRKIVEPVMPYVL